jgi:hypothetical protein
MPATSDTARRGTMVPVVHTFTRDATISTAAASRKTSMEGIGATSDTRTGPQRLRVSKDGEGGSLRGTFPALPAFAKHTPMSPALDRAISAQAGSTGKGGKEDAAHSSGVHDAQKKRLLNMELQEVNQRVTALIDAYGQPPELGAGGEPLTEEQSAVYDEEDYSRLRARQEERVQEVLQEVEHLTEQRVGVLRSLLAWVSGHTGNAALASEAEFEGLEAEVVRLQGRRGSGGHVLEPGTLSDPGAFVGLWTDHMGASASHLGGVHGKVHSTSSQQSAACSR